MAALLYRFEGELSQGCTGTLIDETVVLTAAHCVLGWEDPLYVSFYPNWMDDPDPMLVSEIHTHPDAFCCGSNDWFDIAVLILPEQPSLPDGSGLIAPAPLPTENLLGEMSASELRGTTFTAVGYGAIRETRMMAWQSIGDAEGWRSFGQQSALSLTKAWLTLSMNQATGDAGTCYGDSGGPHFLPDGTVVSITVTGDRWCKATDKTYRVDTEAARDFLDDFVTLP